MWSVRITPGGAGSRPSLSVARVSSLTLSPPRGCGASAQPRTRYLSASSPLEGDRVDVAGVVVEGRTPFRVVPVALRLERSLVGPSRFFGSGVLSSLFWGIVGCTLGEITSDSPSY